MLSSSVYKNIFPIFHDEKFCGTGFCIYYDEKNTISYILTCYHVVYADGELLEDIKVYNKQLTHIASSEIYDMSIFSISLKIQPLKLSIDHSVTNTTLYSLQDISNNNHQIGQQVSSQILKDSIEAAYYCNDQAIPLIRLEITDKKAKIQPGNSGSPVLCQSTERVIAMANIKLDNVDKAEKAFAIDMAYLKKVWEGMPENLVVDSLENLKKDIRKPQKVIIDYFATRNVTPEKLLKSCKKYLDKTLLASLAKHKSIEEIVNHLKEDEKFICVVIDLYENDNAGMDSWIAEQEKTDCQSLEAKEETTKDPRLVIIFKHIEDYKYDVTFRTKNLPYKSDANDSKIYNLAKDKDTKKLKEQEVLTKKIMKLVDRYNPKVDLVLPKELMIKPINLWEVDFNESLSTLSRLTIRDYERYNSREDILRDILKPQWDEVVEKIDENQSLFCISKEEHVRSIGSNMREYGLAAKFLLEEKHIKPLLKTTMSYIMLWITRDYDEDLKKIYEKSPNELQNNYFALSNQPINLMWDDPYTYYNPDKPPQGE